MSQDTDTHPEDDPPIDTTLRVRWQADHPVVGVCAPGVHAYSLWWLITQQLTGNPERKGYGRDVSADPQP